MNVKSFNETINGYKEPLFLRKYTQDSFFGIYGSMKNF